MFSDKEKCEPFKENVVWNTVVHFACTADPVTHYAGYVNGPRMQKEGARIMADVARIKKTRVNIE